MPFTNVSRSQSELAVFGRISKEKIIELCDFFSNEIPYVPPDLSKLKRILGNGFVMDDIAELGAAFYNFVIGKRNPEKIFEIIDMSKLDADKKSVVSTSAICSSLPPLSRPCASYCAVISASP